MKKEWRQRVAPEASDENLKDDGNFVRSRRRRRGGC